MKKIPILILCGITLASLGENSSMEAASNVTSTNSLFGLTNRRCNIIDAFHTVLEGGGGSGGPRSSTTPSTLTLTSTTSISKHNDLEVNKSYDTNSYAAGICGHFRHFSVISMKRMVGVYSNIFSYYGKEALANGDAYEETEYQSVYTYTNTEAVSFYSSMDFNLAAKISVEGTYGSLSGSATATVKSMTGYAYSNTTTYNTIATKTHRYGLKLSKESAKLCPDGYSMSFGLVGTYYVLTVKSLEYTVWWWGNYPTAGAKEETYQVVISNEGTMAKNYVFQKNGDNEQLYYLKD